MNSTTVGEITEIGEEQKAHLQSRVFEAQKNPCQIGLKEIK